MGNKGTNGKSTSTRLQDTTVRDEVDVAAREALECEEDLSLQTKVQINLGIRGVKDSGYYCVRVSNTNSDSDLVSIGTTEAVHVVSDVMFVKTVVSDFTFESPQKLLFEMIRLPRMVVDDQSVSSVHYGESKIIDTVECSLAQIVSSPNSYLLLDLSAAESLSVYAEEIKILQNLVAFDVSISGFRPTTQSTKAKQYGVYVSLHRTTAGESQGSLQPQFIKTEEILSSKHPPLEWKGLKTSVNAMCRGDVDAPVLVYIWEVVGSCTVQSGKCSFKYDQLREACAEGTNLVLDYAPGCTVDISAIKISRGNSFLDYISSGLEISLFVGIDFTKSNKDANLPDSLHRLDASGRPSNDYVQAIKSVVQILEHYDSDQKLPVFGFGARLPPSYTHCSHLFACNGDIFSPEVVGTQGVLDAYSTALKSVLLHGPTNFHDIIALVSQVAEIAMKTPEKLRYYVLLILTDGVISDMRATIDEIVRASELPVSIIIVGVGDEDFALMNMLDGDDHRLRSTVSQTEAARDIVQFVPFNPYRNGPVYQLAMETLDEIPREVVNYFESKGIDPGSNSTLPVQDKESPFVQYLTEARKDFTDEVLSSDPTITQADITRIMEQNKIPSRNVQYFSDVLSNGPADSNVFDQNRRSKTPISEITHRPTRSSQSTPDNVGIQDMCHWCKDRQVNTILIPCGHALFCQKCTDHVGSQCPACQHPVTRIIPKLPAL